MDVIVRANEVLFEEVKEKDMCEAIRDLFRDEIEEATKELKVQSRKIAKRNRRRKSNVKSKRIAWTNV